MISHHSINGQITPVEKAALQVNDLAILRGYGIFDYFLFRRRQPLFLEDYLTRFLASAARMHLPMPVSRPVLRGQILELIESNSPEEGAIRLVLTGGYAEDGYSPSRPNLIIMQHPMPQHPESRYTDGVKLMLHRYQRDLPQVKTINYMQGIRLLPELKKAGALEPLYHDGQYVRESVRSNIFLLTADNRLVTPCEQILLGITRLKVIELARNYYEVEEREIRIEELEAAREVFLTGSSKRVMPVVQIDEMTFGDGRPGPVTRRLIELFEVYSRDYLTNPMVGG